MSFLNISDPKKRDLIVKEYLELKKNIRDNLLSERTGEQQLQTDLSKIFKPITETQKATSRVITKDLSLSKRVSRTYRRLLRFPPIRRYKLSKNHQKEKTLHILVKWLKHI